jgi:excisionase family DNA binding protein
MEDLLTVKEVSKMLGITESRVYGLSYRGIIPCIRLSDKFLRFRRADVEAFIQSRTVYSTTDLLDSLVDKIVNQAKMEVLFGSPKKYAACNPVTDCSCETEPEASNSLHEDNTKDTKTEDKWTTIYSSLSKVGSPVNTRRNWQIWKPKEGDAISGKILEINNVASHYGGDAYYTKIQTANNQIYTIFLNKVLLDFFSKENIHKGDTVTIKFLGLFKGTGGIKRFKNYIVTKENNTRGNQLNNNTHDDLVTEIRSLRAQGKSYRQIAEATGISHSKVYRILVKKHNQTSVQSESGVSTLSQIEQRGHNSMSCDLKPIAGPPKQAQTQSWIAKVVGKIIRKIRGGQYGSL